MTDKWMSLLEVYEEVAADPFWESLRRPGVNLVRGDGPTSAETAKVLVVGEAPGAQENGARRPFVGPSGQVLDSLLSRIGLRRPDVFITNVVKYHPPGNRTPDAKQIKQGQIALRREWSIIQPVLTIAVGTPAAVALGLRGTSQYHGIPAPFGSGDDSWATRVYHPAFGLRQPKAQEWIEEEWERLWKEMQVIGINELVCCRSCKGMGVRSNRRCRLCSRRG